MFKCSSQLRYCEARNLYIDFRRYREMIKKEGHYRRSVAILYDFSI